MSQLHTSELNRTRWHPYLSWPLGRFLLRACAVGERSRGRNRIYAPLLQGISVLVTGLLGDRICRTCRRDGVYRGRIGASSLRECLVFLARACQRPGQAVIPLVTP